MDLKQYVYEGVASVLIVVQRFFLLLFYPYKTMRTIAKEKDILQPAVIFSTILIYYLSLERVKEIQYNPYVQFLLVIFNFLLTIGFIALFSYIHNKKITLKSFIFLFSYALIPTIVWFYVNTFLFVALPPPRHVTFLGKVFSITFITFSVSVLAWKIILFYLAIRFSTRLQFYDILYIIIIYLALVIPYSLLLYHFGFFRIPFL